MMHHHAKFHLKGSAVHKILSRQTLSETELPLCVTLTFTKQSSIFYWTLGGGGGGGGGGKLVFNAQSAMMVI